MKKATNPIHQVLSDLRGVRPGGGRKKYVHVMVPLLEAPANLTAPEKELYEDIRTHAPQGLLMQVDRALLSVFVQHAVLHERCIRELNELYSTSDTGVAKVHPLATLALSQMRALVACAESLGLASMARQRIKLPEAPVDSAWTDLRNRTEPA